MPRPINFFHHLNFSTYNPLQFNNLYDVNLTSLLECGNIPLHQPSLIKKPKKTPRKKKDTAPITQVNEMESLTESVTKSVLAAKVPLIQNIDGFFVKKKSNSTNLPTLKDRCATLENENRFLREKVAHHDEQFAILSQQVASISCGTATHAESLSIHPALALSSTSHVNILPGSAVLALPHAASGASLARTPANSSGLARTARQVPLKGSASIEKKIEVVNILKKDSGKTRGLLSKIAHDLGVCPTTVTHWRKKYGATPAVMSPDAYKNRTRLRYGKFTLLELILVEWLTRVRYCRNPRCVNKEGIKKKSP